MLVILNNFQSVDRGSNKHRSWRQATKPLRKDFSLRRLVNTAILISSGAVIVSYPRSGRTWLRVMLHELSINPVFSHGAARKMLYGDANTMRHDIPDYFGNRVLLLLRDPRDLIVSYFHHCVRQNVWDGDLSGFIRHPIFGFERLLAFTLGWLEAHGRFKDFATVRYEDLRQDTEIELKRVVAFLGCTISGPQALSKVVAEQSFEQMKYREKSGELHARYGKRFTPGSENDNERIVRRGVIGSHVDEMARAERDFCENMLARYDYHAANRLDVGLTGPAGGNSPS